MKEGTLFSFLLVLSFVGGCLSNDRYIDIADGTLGATRFVDLYPIYTVEVYGDYMEPVVHVVYVAEENGQTIKYYVGIDRDTKEVVETVVEVREGEILRYSTYENVEFFKRGDAPNKEDGGTK